MEEEDITMLDVTPDCSIFGVFDGHGGFYLYCDKNIDLYNIGRGAALFCSKFFPEFFVKTKYFKEGDIEGAIRQTCSLMDHEMKDNAHDDFFTKNNVRIPRKVSSGCTANIIILYQNYIYCANIGDSRSVLNHNGSAFALSNDHKPSN